ncbi:MAG: hypothetical protein H6917_01370 [Novosphingobium sp.]|nr:hypothetical protein [Novosphingobium sp.]
MIDTSRPDPEDPKARARKGALPDFAPVPRKCNRHDGWTAERQRGFIEALADLGSVRAAANAVNMTPEGAYQLRRHPEAGGFRKAWKAALALGVQRLEDVAMDRALNGVEVPVFCFGELIDTRRVYNDRLLMFMLRNRAPKRFGEDGRMNLADRASLANLEREWRAQWDRERAELDRERSKQAQAGIEEKVARWTERKRLEMARAMRKEWLRIGGPPPLPGEPEWKVPEKADDED